VNLQSIEFLNMTNTVTQLQTVELDPLGLTVDEWANIAKTATVEAIESAHLAGLSTVGALDDGKLARTLPDGTVIEWQP
jgi:hypothetical protein